MSPPTGYNYAVVKAFIAAAVLYGIAAMAAGLLASLQIIYPVLNFSTPMTSFGRIRPFHTCTAIFGFSLSIVFAAIYHSMQRLQKTPLFSTRLAWIHFIIYNLTVIAADVSLLFGRTQGKEFAELEWPFDILIIVSWLIFAVNFFGTLSIRGEKQMFVSIWFYMASVIAFPILFIVNNLAVPAGFLKSYSIYSGVFDANVQWWYGHNLFAFILTVPFLGIMYYYFPKHIRQPIYSHRLSVVHFWSMIVIFIWTGPHHLIYSPLPDWLQTLGTAFSIMLILPCWGALVNGFLTLSQAREKIQTDAALKFFILAIVFYGMSTFEGPIMSIKTVNGFSHFTDWTIAHVHSGTMGWVGFISFAMLYYLVPVIWNRRLYSETLANVHFWFGIIGIMLYVVSMWSSGLTEGAMWRAFDPSGHLQYPDWIMITEVLRPLRIGRAIGGSLYLAGFLFLIINLLLTVFSAKTKIQNPVESVTGNR